MINKWFALNVFFNRIDKHLILDDKGHKINLKTSSCACQFFLKYAVCSHILGYKYKSLTRKPGLILSIRIGQQIKFL